jgi:hypothetical protein
MVRSQRSFRKVQYGTQTDLGCKLKKGEIGWQEGKEIYQGGLPPSLQYLWVRYEPEIPRHRDYPVDFTWEREWRIKVNEPGLSVLLKNDNANPAVGAIIVPRDAWVSPFEHVLARLAKEGKEWARRLKKIISLETAQREIDRGDMRFARIDTLPD